MTKFRLRPAGYHGFAILSALSMQLATQAVGDGGPAGLGHAFDLRHCCHVIAVVAVRDARRDV